MSDEDEVLVRRDDLHWALGHIAMPDGDTWTRLLAAVNGEAATVEMITAQRDTAWDALREIEAIMRTAGSDTTMLDGIAAIVSNGPLDTAPGGPREDECHRLIGERDRYREALETAQGEAYLGALDGDDTPTPLAACHSVMSVCVGVLRGEQP